MFEKILESRIEVTEKIRKEENAQLKAPGIGADFQRHHNKC